MTNQFAGSDGDIFSHCFKLYKLGPLVGKRTWGGVIGIDPYHHLVDGTLTTQPEYSFWFIDVGWKVENYGTDPDYDVDISPQDYREGRDPQMDFTVNANGTLNLLEATRRHAPSATFVFCSTNKVYGDLPNALPLVELDERLELPADHRYYPGIDTTMSIDASTHSLFGVSKASADLLVQEYGRYFDMPTVCFRGGCLTGPNHAGTKLHGFLSYLMRCTMTGQPYTVFGYGGKQVRDNIHSADLVTAFAAFHAAPRPAAVYNIGGGRESNCSMLEAIALCEQIAGSTLDWTLGEENRIGDHRWWISDLDPFKRDFPGWGLSYGIERILREIHERNAELWLERG